MKTESNCSEAAERFAPVAQRYCSLVDSRSALEKPEFLLQIYRMLPELIAEAIRLQEVVFGDDENEEQDARLRQIRVKTEMNQVEWGQHYTSLKEKLGDWNLYWQVFDPRTDNEAIYGSLADDIADIYRDLKNGLALRESNEVSAYIIVFDWQFKYWSHWGKHAIDALRVIHFILEERTYS